MSANILKAIAVASELTGAELSEAALEAMELKLSRYPEDRVLQAIDVCVDELTGRLTYSAILSRLHSADGRLSSDEAWAVAVQADDESETVVWTPEIERAWAVALPIFQMRDKVGARMAFREAYDRQCFEARAENRPVEWKVSDGWDGNKRAAAVEAAVISGHISQDKAALMLPAPKDAGIVGRLLLGSATKEDAIAAPGIVARCQLMLARMKKPSVEAA